MTIADLIKSLIDSSKERIKTPITGAFIISFIAYNWKAILFLLFSTSAIEDKLAFISYKYCSLSALLWPIAIAIAYSILVPYLMMFIESVNKKAKQKRQINIYDEKIDEVILKIKLADQELKLQDKLSRNQEKEEMLNKIQELESNIKTKSDSQKAIEDDYRNQIRDLTRRLSKSNSSKNEQGQIEINFNDNFADLSQSTLKHFIGLIENLNSEDISQLTNLRTNFSTKIKTQRLSKKLLEFLLSNGLVNLKNSEYHFSELGLKFKSYVEFYVGLKK